MSNTTSQNILGTAANLLGFCLFVITSLRLNSRAETHLISEATSIIAVLLTISCGFSFVSLRTKDPNKERILERVADYFFIASLIGILIIILWITRNFIDVPK